MSEENKILNKGLDALLGQSTNNNQKSVKELSVEDINPGRFQPRTNFDEEKLLELTNSIKNHGVLSPILVREVGLNKYEVIAGERRLRASKNAGLKTIPTLIDQKQDKDALESALIENLQREDLNAVEEARGYDRLKREFSVEANIGKPQVAYRETIKETIDIEGKFVRQSGGKGQYGHVWLKLEPLGLDDDYEFVDEIVGGVVPKEYIPAVDKGIQEQMQNGVVAGYPLLALKATLYDGSYHDVDSSEMAFKIAGSMALKEGALKAKPVILEPIMKVEVVTPEEHMGDVVGDLNRRRGIILGMDEIPSGKTVQSEVPLSEMFGYATDLRSQTQGRASFSMEFLKYADVPSSIAEELKTA